MRGNNKEKNPHILNASANLLGICFVLITGLKISAFPHSTVLYGILLATSFMFLISTLLSYLSIRTDKLSNSLEQWADYFFLASVLTLFVSTLLLASDLI